MVKPDTAELKITALEFYMILKRGVDLYDYIALRLIALGVPVEEVTESYVRVKHGVAEVTELPDNTMHIFWYSDKKFLN